MNGEAQNARLFELQAKSFCIPPPLTAEPKQGQLFRASPPHEELPAASMLVEQRYACTPRSWGWGGAAGPLLAN